MDLCGIALTGLDNAREQIETSGRRLASAASPDNPGDTIDLSSAAAQLMAARNQYETNLQVLETGDQMERQTIDLLA
jgi:hypothetical protein